MMYQGICLETNNDGSQCKDVSLTGKTEIFKSRKLAVWCIRILHRVAHTNCRKFEIREAE